MVVTLLPIILLGTLIVISGMTLITGFYTQSIQDELISTTSVMLDSLDLTARGDYSYEDGILRKGSVDLTNSTMLYHVKETSDIDTTIFWKDTRVMTTVANEEGNLAVGTKASDEVVEAVLANGRNYYSNNLDVNGMTYIGSYMPLKNSDGTIVGMVFAGESKRSVYVKVSVILLSFALLAVFSIVIAFVLSRIYSRKMVSDIDRINRFIRSISEGDLTVSLNDKIIKREDEIGQIGRNTSKMKDDLRKLIETDPLTALYNRRSCDSMLRAMEEAGEAFCIVMSDVDWFKKINDQYGHDMGDYVLTRISEMIRENVKGCGFASRWGGEEFLLIYKLDLDTVKSKVEQLQVDIREHVFQYAGKQAKITMTFGIEASGHNQSYEKIIKEADRKLYAGKNSGRDKIVC